MPTVSILTTGYEVLRGFTVDTNSSWLARRATECGARVVALRTVGDALSELVGALRAAAAEADAVLVTGGLGPTEDDRTREALAIVAGVDLEDDPRALRIVSDHLARAGRPLAPMQRRQGQVPRGFEPLLNPEGTAPGVAGRALGRRFFLLPGPPREMRAMFEAEVLPRWRADGGFDEAAARVVWTAGAAESDVALPIAVEMRADEPTVGTHPDDGEVAVRILARGARAAERADLLRDDVVRRLGSHVVSTSEDRRIQHAVVALLGVRGLELTTAESITGGLVSRMLVEVPGASAVFRGGLVTYSDDWKRDAAGRRLRRCSSGAARCRRRSPSPWPTAPAPVPAPRSRWRRPASRGRVPTRAASTRARRSSACRVAFEPTFSMPMRAPVPRLAVQRRAAVLALDQVRRLLLRNGPGR